MKMSLKWLNDYVDVSDFYQKPEELGEILTRAGLEVEEMQNSAKDLHHVVVGYILEKDKHPNADKLSLCRVTTGEGVLHQIVCGAQNHKTGDYVVVALPGAVLPGNFAIKQAQVRGVDSGGMLCSATELGLSEKTDGIMILPADAPLGKSFAEYKGLDDVVFELKVTPNRADCLSHFGLAREIACLLKRDLKVSSPKVDAVEEKTNSKISVNVEAADLAPRYMGVYIDQVQVGKSPDWLKLKLEGLGMKSINNIVDVTNFVMMELGQPLHAFDADQIAGQKIQVKRATAGEKFVSLDGEEHTLSGEELTIRDQEKALCLAGVIGGKNSGVSDSTKNIFLESAYFLPMSVRKTARSLGIETDSAYRFSRGVDPEGAAAALMRAAELISQVSGGRVYSEPIDVYTNKVTSKAVCITLDFVSQKLGYPAVEETFLDYVRRLGCAVGVVEGVYEIIPPSYRFDLEQDVDFVEEYARIHGYEHIPERLPATSAEPVLHDKGFVFNQRIAKAAQAYGYLQAFNFAFVGDVKEQQILGNKQKLKASGLSIGEESIRLLNPLNEDLNIMRSTLSFGLLQNMFKNFHQGNLQGRLFESGQTFFKNGENYQEAFRFAAVVWGKASDLWTKESEHPVIFEVKGLVEQILRSLSITSFSWTQVSSKEDVPDFCHQGQYAVLKVEGKNLGYIASVHPGLLAGEKIRVPVALVELELESLIKGQTRSVRVTPLSNFPVIERDLALVAKESLAAAEIAKVIGKAAGSLLVNLKVFDVYQGDKLDKGSKSVAFRMYFQDKNATLQDSQIAEVQNRITEALKAQLGVTIR